MNESILHLRRVSLAYTAVPLFHDLDLTLRKGETVLLAGRNGSGKTTLLRLLAGALRPDSGRVDWEGGLQGRHIAHLADSLSFYGEWTVRRGLDFHRRVHGLAEVDDSLLRLADIPAAGRVGHLSAGQRVVFLLTLLLAQQPQLLLIDEVLSRMDPYTRELLFDALIDRIARERITLVFASHAYAETARLAERIILLGRGGVVLDETAERLPALVRKVVGELPDSSLPVFFRKEGGCFPEYYIYPFREESRDRSDLDFQEIPLAEILQAFIGGTYVGQGM